MGFFIIIIRAFSPASTPPALYSPRRQRLTQRARSLDGGAIVQRIQMRFPNMGFSTMTASSLLSMSPALSSARQPQLTTGVKSSASTQALTSGHTRFSRLLQRDSADRLLPGHPTELSARCSPTRAGAPLLAFRRDDRPPAPYPGYSPVRDR